MNDDERVQSLVDQEAAKILQEILAKPDQRMEYGALIYVDYYGVVRHTPLRASSDFRTNLGADALPKNAMGVTDYSRVLAMIHSHPQELPNEDGSPGYTNYFDENDPDRLLVPSVRTDMPDDWAYFDDVSARLTSAGADASVFSLIIAGYNGTTLVLNKYGASDHGTTSSASGESISSGFVSPVNSCPLHG